MRFRLVNIFFILIGIAVGVILSLQVNANPVRTGSSPVEQIELQKTLLQTFSIEQNDLKQKLAAVETRLDETKKTIEKRSSSRLQKTLQHLKNLTGLDTVIGDGIKITLSDNPAVSRTDFSAINESFVQAADLRDLVNALFLQDAQAIDVNGRRILPLTPIQPVFDSVLVGNLQISSPFIVSAIGHPDTLKTAVEIFQNRRIHVFVEAPVELKIGPAEALRAAKTLSLL